MRDYSDEYDTTGYVLKIVLCIILILLILGIIIKICSNKKMKRARPRKMKKNRLVLYYDEQCKHCQNFMPIWYNIRDRLKNKEYIDVYSISVNLSADTCRNYNICQVPTLRFHDIQNYEYEDYSGPLTEQAVLGWLSRFY